VENTPACMFKQNRPTLPVNTPRKPPAFVINDVFYNTNSGNISQPMPIAVDNELPAIAMRFGTSDNNEISFYVNVDFCAGLNIICNLIVYQ